MKNFIFCITLTISTMASSSVSLANDPAATIEAVNYFDANWTLFNVDAQSYQPPVDKLATISLDYLDANWAVFNAEDQAIMETINNILAKNNDGVF